MRVVMTHVYSNENKGDAAILACQLKELRRVFESVAIEVFTLERVGDDETFEGMPLRRSLMSTVVGGGAPRILRPLLGVMMMSSTLAWAAVERVTGLSLPMASWWRGPLLSLRDCDAQVCVGGGYLRAKDSFHSTYLLLLLAHQVVLGRLLGKPVYLYAQSFGPFPGVGQKFLFRMVSRATSLILPRESISFEVAQQAASGRTPVVRVIDSAFLVDGAERASLDHWFPAGRPPVVVGVTAREWLEGAGQLDYERALQELISDVLSRGWGVLLIPQVTATAYGDDDRVVGRRLAQHFGSQPRFVLVEANLDVGQIVALYSALDFMVGTRFHSVIFCLCAAVPCLAIEYEHKTRGILKDLGLEEWCLPIEEVTGARLIALFARLIEHKPKLVPMIVSVVSEARSQAQLGANLIAAHYRARPVAEEKLRAHAGLNS